MFFYPYINWQDHESCPGTSISTVLDSLILSSNTKDEKDISAFLGLKLLKEITQKQVYVTPSGEVKIEEFSVEAEKHIPKRNKPYLIKSDHQIDPLNYLEALISGFSDAYQALLKNRSKLSEQKKFLGYIKKSKTRLVLRPTSIYLKLLKNMNHMSNLNDYTKYYEELGWLNNNSHFGNSSSSICFSECAQLLQGDVPTFYYDATLKKVVDGYGNYTQIKVVLDGEQNFLKLVGDNLSQDDLHAQVELIKQAAAVYEYNTDILYSSSTESASCVDRNVLTKKGYLKIAGEILDCLSKKRIIRDYDNVNWTYPAEDLNKKLGLTWCDPSMYHGISGIGLSFLYGTLFFKNDTYKEIVTCCLLSIDVITKRKEIFNNLGAFSGLGGILYFLDKTAKIIPELGASEIINRVLILLDEKLDDLLNHELCVDIISGSSGLLAVLAGLKCNHNKILHITKRLMHHIIDRYPPPLNYVNSENASDRFMLGFSHGISGMVFAMHRALKISPMPAALEWITRALRYERGYFDIEKGDWPNFFKDPGRKANNILPLGWCHGIMGIVMSRLEMYQQGWNDDVILFEIALLMKGMSSYQMPKTLNLCHGLMGVMDFLLQAQSYQYTSIAPNRFEQQVTAIMNRLGETGKICTEFHEKIYTPGLMVGHAGVAYQCLRIVDKTLVPSVLLLQ